MDTYAKDWFEVIAWVVGIAGGIVGLARLVAENRLGRRQREKEQRWRMAGAANDLLASFYADPVFRNAMLMLDWDDRPFEVAPGVEVTISRADLWKALERPPLPFDAKNLFIRTAMDRMFEAFDRIGHSISVGVMTGDDIHYAFEFFIRVLAQQRTIVELYMKELGFEQALELFNSSRAWNPAIRQA